MNCPTCGGSRFSSSGANYKCKKKGCGRMFRKNPRQRKITIEERPICPDCGVGNPYSLGFCREKKVWCCRACGRNFTGESGKIEQIEVGANLEVQVE